MDRMQLPNIAHPTNPLRLATQAFGVGMYYCAAHGLSLLYHVHLLGRQDLPAWSQLAEAYDCGPSSTTDTDAATLIAVTILGRSLAS
ncbi:hypothetical protein CFRS1_v006178 [Colletotrichum fructicola]|nr:hypothetical protein CFRS1_v006178 [Colletotrichum fructicola]